MRILFSIIYIDNNTKRYFNFYTINIYNIILKPKKKKKKKIKKKKKKKK